MDPISLPDLLVLIVEPSPTQRRIIASALQNAGVHNTLHSESGGHALSRLAEDAPDLVVSALYLPDMTGTDLIHRIRASAGHAHTPFLLISSETRLRYLDPVRQAGVAGILPKPFTDDQLRTALATTLELLDVSPSEPDELSDQDLRVLVVDDSGLSRKHISRVLDAMGIEHIDHAADGLEAVALIAQNYYDFVVTDYNMPHMDGKELIEHIRNASSQATMPVLMVTSEHNTQRLAAVQRSGVSAICDKPFQPAMVRRLIRQMVDA